VKTRGKTKCRQKEKKRKKEKSEEKQRRAGDGGLDLTHCNFRTLAAMIATILRVKRLEPMAF